MQSPPLDPSKTPTNHSTTLATIAAICAILAVPFAFIPFVGLAASTFVLGFIGALAIWTRRKRAFIGTGIAMLAIIISIISSFVVIGGIINSRDAATAKLAQMQTQLETLKAQSASAPERSALGGLIKMFDTGNDLTNDQANTLGKLGEWAIKSVTSESTPAPNDNSKP